MRMSVSLIHPFVETIQIASTPMAATTVSVMEDSHQHIISHKQIRLNAKTSMNVWRTALCVVLMQTVQILKELIIAHVKLATFPATEKRYLMQDKEFTVM
ncbi:hypothetical protein M9458_057078, partial [Cirrhinus mrigala]